MARSAEAIRKRALKRDRTVQDQRKADSKDVAAGEEREKKRRTQKVPGEKKKEKSADDDSVNVVKPADGGGKGDADAATKKKRRNKKVPGEKKKEKSADDDNVNVVKPGDGGGKGDADAATKESNTTIKKTPEKEERAVDDKEKDRTIDPALKEPGAWICPGCNNHNFASRRECHSKTCDEKRPAGVHVPPRFQHNPTTQSRHDPATSKTMKWSEQASTDTVENNQALRKRYKETGGEGMVEADVTRAKLLLERDERKKQKKELKKKQGKARK